MRHNTRRHGAQALADDRERDFSLLLEAAAAEEPRAIRELVEEFTPPLTDYARRQGVADPEGMANATLFGALQNLGSFRGRDKGTFRGYLYRILRRRVIDEIRYASSRPRTVGDLGNEFSGGMVDETTSSFDEQIVNEDYIDALLTKLTVEQRQILELRLMNDLSIQETADRTGRSVTAVKAMQRRALLSLRLAAAAMAVVALVMGVRLLLNAGNADTIIENQPADQPSLPVDGGEEQGLAEDGQDDVGLPAPDPDTDTATDDETATDDTATADESATDGGDQPVIEGASSVGVGQQSTTSTVEAPPEDAPTTTVGDPPGDPAPETPVDPASPCTVVTDASPAVGEIGFVTYNFSGPYKMLRGAPAYIVNPAGEPAALTGFGSTEKVYDNKTFPFTIAPNMFNENGWFNPRSAFGGESITSTCERGEKVSQPPCHASTDGSPKAGEEATITYNMVGPYAPLDGRWTYVVGKDGKSALEGSNSQPIEDGAEHTFTIDQSMFDGGKLDIRTAFRGGEGFVRCSVD